jgi:hypothetical protein
MLWPVAVAIRQTIDPPSLLVGWRAQGWRTVRQGIITQVPGDAAGKPTVTLQLDAFEWIDVTFMGVGNTDDALQKLREYIRSGGSDLYAYALFTRTEIDDLGVKVIRYRLVLLHSLVQLLGAAILIIAIAFAAVIFIQYITTGRAPALDDLKSLWGSAVTSVGTAAGQVGQAVVAPYVWAMIALGGIAIAFSSISKTVGVKAPPVTRMPSGSVGVRTGILNAKLSS